MSEIDAHITPSGAIDSLERLHPFLGKVLNDAGAT